MRNLTNEPPEDIKPVIQRLKLYVEKVYNKSDKNNLQTIISNCEISIVKTGNWGKRYGYSQAVAVVTVPISSFDLINASISDNLTTVLDTILQSTDCGLEIVAVEFIPGDTDQPDAEDELNQILLDNHQLAAHLSLPEDLIEKGKMMSEIYLYIYFIENCLRLFIEQAQSNHTITFPREVTNTISKNKTNEEQSKFLPLRGGSDLYYCDFVQLQQIIIHNWEVFKNNFPQQDQHWLRVKIEDIYRVRNLVAHCGTVTKDEFDMIKSNFKMILRQLKFMK